MAVATDQALLDRLDRIERLLERLLEQRDTLTPAQRSVMKAAIALYGPSEPFTTASMVDACRFDTGARQGLLRACNGDVQRLGILLRQIADAGAVVDGLRLRRLPAEAGSRRWTLEDADSL